MKFRHEVSAEKQAGNDSKASWKRYLLIAGFHNSLTIVSTEIEGRNYGGGVLELIPSEISLLAVPLLPVKSQLRHLDRICRKSGGQRDSSDTLIDETDPKHIGRIPPSELSASTDARRRFLAGLGRARRRLREFAKTARTVRARGAVRLPVGGGAAPLHLCRAGTATQRSVPGRYGGRPVETPVVGRPLWRGSRR